ncbi:MAG: penicillin-binding protein activator, partial [Pseudomonadota bacterium]
MPCKHSGAYFFTLVICLFIVSCSVSQGPGGFTQNNSEREAERLAAAGQYRAASDTYWRLAQQTRNELRQQAYQLSAIDYLIRAEAHLEARSRLDMLSLAVQDPILKTQVAFLYARLDSAIGNPDAAIQRLDRLGNQGFPAPLQREFYLTRINIFKAHKKPINALYDQIRLELLQQADQSAVQSSHQTIWNTLYSLPPTQLRLAPKISPNTRPGRILQGWVELAILSKTVLPEAFSQAVNNWRNQFPQHPAERSVMPGLLKVRRPPTIRREAVRHVALLLPLSGKLAESATAVREGVMAAFFQEGLGRNGAIRVYDTHEQDIAALYQRALAEGAYAFIGPLQKETVANLVNTFYPELPRPTLALNEVYFTGQPPSRFFKLALNPESAARIVSERIWAEGHRSASLLFPDNSWGERIRQAFDAHWQQLGGELFTYDRYEPQKFAPAVERLVRQVRYSQPVEDEETGETRRVWRSKAKAIFVAGFPVQMRQIRPQFKYFDAPSDLVFYT